MEGRDIHEWLDKPSGSYGGSHRQFRHDSETVKLVGEIFGEKYGKELAENIALGHIMADHQEEIKKRHIVLLECPKCGAPLEKGNDVCRYCGYTVSLSPQVFESDIKLRNNMEVTVRGIDDSSLPIALPPLHIGGGYTKTVVDDIYSDLPNLEEVEKHFLRLGYGTYTVEALRHKGLSDNDIKKLIIESKKVTKAQIKELLTRQPTYSQPQKKNIYGRILDFFYPVMSPKEKKLMDDTDVAFGFPPRRTQELSKQSEQSLQLTEQLEKHKTKLRKKYGLITSSVLIIWAVAIIIWAVCSGFIDSHRVYNANVLLAGIFLSYVPLVVMTLIFGQKIKKGCNCPECQQIREKLGI